MNELNARAARGIRLLLARQVVVQVLTFGAGVVLARTLDPFEFGLFFIALFFVEIFGLAADFGIGPFLVQRRDQASERDMQVAFSIQQALASLIAVVLFISAPALVSLYDAAPAHSEWLVRALVLQLFLTSWRKMNVVALERSLRYGRLAPIEVAEALTFQTTAVSLALGGFGVWSLVAAALARSALGAILTYVAHPWRVRLVFDKHLARQMIRFGLPFQAQLVANQIGPAVTPLLVGTVIGPRAVGLLTWASSNGRKPLVLVSDVLRVGFSHFSRLQDDAHEVERILARYLGLLIAGSGLWFTLVAVAGPGLVPAIYTSKWSPAVPALILFSAALALDAVAWVQMTVLNSTGQAGYVARAMIAGTAVSIALVVPLVFVIGFLAVPIGYLAGVTVLILVFARRIDYFGALMISLRWLLPAPAAGLAIGLVVLQTPGPRTLVAGAAALSALVAYVLAALAFAPRELRAEVTRSVRRLPPAPESRLLTGKAS